MCCARPPERRKPPPLRPSRLRAGERLKRQVCKRRPTPKLERLLQERGTSDRVRRLGARAELLKAVQVDRLRFDLEAIATLPCDDDVSSNDPSQPRNMVVNRGGCVLRRGGRPKGRAEPGGGG